MSNSMKKEKIYPHEWVFKCSWRGTALNIVVGGMSLKQAQMRAEGRVLKMEGGVHCMEVKPIQQLR